MLREGAVIGGKYRLVRSLGEGGMGAVWAATNAVIGRDVAIKLMLPHLARNEEALHRFFNEARVCASIRDPGIVDILDMGSAEDGSPFIVMELLEGESLESLLERSRTLAPSAIVPLVRDVAHTLALAHERGVVHRDLKPANVFLHAGHKQQTVVKILDFGISKVITESSRFATQTGAVLGSPAYMSPEQAAGTTVDFQTDVYALGVILYEALAGHVPFADAANTHAILLAIATRDVPPIGEIVEGVPPIVSDICDRALQRDRDRRYASVREMASALDQAMQWLASQPQRPSAAGGSAQPAASSSMPMATQLLSAVPGPASGSHPPRGAPARVPLAAGITAGPVSTGITRPATKRSPITIVLAAFAAGLLLCAVLLVPLLATRKPADTRPTVATTSTGDDEVIASGSSGAARPAEPSVDVAPTLDAANSAGASSSAGVSSNAGAASLPSASSAPSATPARAGTRQRVPSPRHGTPPPVTAPLPPTARRADDFR